MKVHYINILLFSLSLNILSLSSEIYNKRNHILILHKATTTSRMLCECELYAPANYDNDLEMKSVMENFSKQTEQRFHEYDDRMKEKRKQCKDKCDKEIQKIILKDKLEKQIAQQLTTLDTNITTEDIPTCICEKSVADKVEKGCLRCGGILGAAMPELGSIGGSLLYALYAWKPVALKVATQYAIDKGLAFGKVYGDMKGMQIVIHYLKDFYVKDLFPGIYQSILKINHYTEVRSFASAIVTQHKATCNLNTASATCELFSSKFGMSTVNGVRGTPAVNAVPKVLNGIVEGAEKTAQAVADAESTRITAVITKKQTGLIEGGFNSTITSIYAAIIAIVVIVLIMVIIYLILRYRRKKKMKKKLQYIKLLEE
ncbi:rifin PIR protein, putative [Plasmodium reichenowi]|uniref:Rifin PIR protein, putative n=1 Tax=Plasmodium reichenowi TaxID=5854 RepID=A0A2P9DHG4_PLARE|nr:rifin PIR protein, putative [Plasmodium reichenowi]